MNRCALLNIAVAGEESSAIPSLYLCVQRWPPIIVQRCAHSVGAICTTHYPWHSMHACYRQIQYYQWSEDLSVDQDEGKEIMVIFTNTGWWKVVRRGRIHNKYMIGYRRAIAEKVEIFQLRFRHRWDVDQCRATSVLLAVKLSGDGRATSSDEIADTLNAS